MAEKVVMITGASGNLGLATAKVFYEKGHRLALVDHSSGRLVERFSYAADKERVLFLESIDVTDSANMQLAVKRTLQRFGQIDMLVNTVGTYRGGSAVHETSLETWELLMRVNVRSVLVSSQAVIPTMLEQGEGKIVNVAARAALVGKARMAAYSAAKSAVVRLTEGMAEEMRANHIQVNCVLPGTIDTPENREAMPKADHSRWVSPTAIAEVIYFLCSPAANEVSGAAIPVYGKS